LSFADRGVASGTSPEICVREFSIVPEPSVAPDADPIGKFQDVGVEIYLMNGWTTLESAEPLFHAAAAAESKGNDETGSDGGRDTCASPGVRH
jgi:hypothetical protein